MGFESRFWFVAAFQEVWCGVYCYGCVRLLKEAIAINPIGICGICGLRGRRRNVVGSEVG